MADVVGDDFAPLPSTLELEALPTDIILNPPVVTVAYPLSPNLVTFALIWTAW